MTRQQRLRNMVAAYQRIGAQAPRSAQDSALVDAQFRRAEVDLAEYVAKNIDRIRVRSEKRVRA